MKNNALILDHVRWMTIQNKPSFGHRVLINLDFFAIAYDDGTFNIHKNRYTGEQGIVTKEKLNEILER